MKRTQTAAKPTGDTNALPVIRKCSPGGVFDWYAYELETPDGCKVVGFGEEIHDALTA